MAPIDTIPGASPCDKPCKQACNVVNLIDRQSWIKVPNNPDRYNTKIQWWPGLVYNSIEEFSCDFSK